MKESYSTAQMGSRRRLLHTCGVSFKKIVHGAYIRAQRFDGPFCSITDKIASIGMLSSLVHFVVQYHSHLLTILSLMDDQILTLENSVEAIFPPSKHVFDMLDKLVEIAETLPAKVDWASACAIAWLNFWLSILSNQTLENSKEKDIVVDISCDDSVGETAVAPDVIHQAKEDSIDSTSVASESEFRLGGGANVQLEITGTRVAGGTYKDAPKKAKKVTYKDVLENGRKEEKCYGGTNEGLGDEECYRKNQRNSDVIKEENGGARRKDNIEWPEDGSTYKDAAKKGRKEDTEKEEAWDEGTEERLRKEGRGKAQTADVSVVEKGNKGAKKSVQRQGDVIREGTNAGGEDGSVKEMQEHVCQDDAILALFESAWLMKPGERGKERLMARCASYQW